MVNETGFYYIYNYIYIYIRRFPEIKLSQNHQKLVMINGKTNGLGYPSYDNHYIMYIDMFFSDLFDGQMLITIMLMPWINIINEMSRQLKSLRVADSMDLDE